MVSTVPKQPVQTEPPSETSATGVLLLPSHLFFVRSLALPAGIQPEEVASFVEVSLEQISPFNLAQLAYGYYLPPESSRLLVFAAYRKKLEIYVDEVWEQADLVVPDLVSVLGLQHEGPTLLFLQSELEVTAIYWAAGGGVPDRVVSRLVNGGNAASSMEAVREDLRRKLGTLPPGLKTIVLQGSPVARFRDRNLVFDLRQEGGAEGPAADIPQSQTLALDVRDKAFLESSRKARRQNRWLWNGVLAIVACFIALAVFEVALFAGRQMLQTRQERVRALQPEVARIMQEQQLAIRLEEISGDRLMPFEMLSLVNQHRPRSIHFTRVATAGLREILADAQTANHGDVETFRQNLERAPGVESVDIQNLRVRGGTSTFTLALTVTREGLQRLTAPPAAAAAGTSRQRPAPAAPETPAEPAPPPANGEQQMTDLPAEEVQP
jgi:hypothetical protein